MLWELQCVRATRSGNFEQWKKGWSLCQTSAALKNKTRRGKRERRENVLECVSKNRCTPKWMVYNGKPYSNGWFGGTPIFGDTLLELLNFGTFGRCVSRFFGPAFDLAVFFWPESPVILTLPLPKMPETFRFGNSFARIWGHFEAHIFLFAGFCLLIHEFVEFLWDQCRDAMGIRDSQIALLEDRTLCCHWEASRLQAGYTNEQWQVRSPGCLATN